MDESGNFVDMEGLYLIVDGGIISGVAFSALTSTHQKLRRQHGVNGLRASEKIMNALLGF